MTTEPIRRIKRGWMNLKIIQIKEEAHDTKTLIFEDADEGGRAFDYLPGQYLTFRFDNLAPKPIVRSYTMSSSPCQPNIEVTVKIVDNGLVSRYLCEKTQVGDVLVARGAMGGFVFRPEKDNSHLVFIAGGSGVTPFVSMIREYAPSLGKEGFPKTMTLLVSYRTREDIICWSTLREANYFNNTNVLVSLSREKVEEDGFFFGRISKDMLDKALNGDYKDKTYMICGPENLMSFAITTLKDSGVPDQHIKTESFEN